MREATGGAIDATPAIARSPGQFILHHAKAWRWHFVALLLLVVTAASCGVGIQYSLKLLVDAMAGPREFAGPLVVAIGTLLALVAFEGALWRLVAWLTCRTTVGVGVDVRLQLFAHLSTQPMRYFADNLAGSLGQRITATAGNFGALTNTCVWRIIPPLVDGIGACIIFATVEIRLAVALGVLAALVMLAMIWFGYRGRLLHRTYSREAAEVGGDLTDVISNMWTVKAFSARERELRRLEGRFRHEAQAQRRSWMYLERARLLHDVVLWFLAAGALTWAINLWMQGRITPGDVVVIVGLTLRLLHSSKDMALSLIDAVQQVSFIDETLRTIAQPRSLVDTDANIPAPRQYTLEFRNVNFSYGSQRVLRDIDLHVAPGEKVGVVGASGAGKSTLIQLIQRLYDVDTGAVVIGGVPVTDLKQDALRDLLAVVPQEITLLHRTVAENIRFARPDASDAEVYAAAKAAACDGFIRRLPEGYSSLVGERGVKLSGGQRQRIGIARAFLRSAPVILLDEATSALDTESELQITAALNKTLKDRTVIAVAHRLSTIATFDRIIVLHDGRIVEDGTFDELRALGGTFAAMWRRQVSDDTFEKVRAKVDERAA